ncbi:MAG: GTPase Era [Proteobacteria bacterium]|nr:GTPase Era [Pseudomonadota bacterium]
MNETQKDHRKCGTIGILGRPNAGKSTLLNAFIGRKIVGISRKPETTSHRILGVLTEGNTQLLLLDTPGLLPEQQKSLRSRRSQGHAGTATMDADIILYLIDARNLDLTKDIKTLQKVIDKKKQQVKVVIVLSKADTLKNHILMTRAQQTHEWLRDHWPDHHHFYQPPHQKSLPIFLSAKQKQSVQQLKELLITLAPTHPFLFSPDTITDKSDTFIAAELITEQIFRHTGAEIPYQTHIEVSERNRKPGIITLDCTIGITKKSHKGIILGQHGDMIKSIREKSEEGLQNYFKCRVKLHLWVKLIKQG